MAIKYSPKVGEIVFCNYGLFKTLQDGSSDKKNINGKIPPEMVKNRLVVVLNGRINNACVVVPLSSSLDQDKVTKKWHVPISANLIAGMAHFTPKDRWAKCDHVQQVSKERLFPLPSAQHIPFNIVADIQTGVMRAIGGATLLVPPATSSTQPIATSPAATLSSAPLTQI